MASKQTSIFGPFIVTAIGGITLGLIVMYFGYYQGRISSYERHIAEFQNKPTPEISFTYTVKESSPVQKLIEQESSSNHETSETSGAMKSESVTESFPKDSAHSGQRPSSAQTAASRPPQRGKRTQSSATSGMAQTQVQTRGPAFPKTQDRQQADEHDDDRESYSKAPPHIPDIDDPELDENPLIRAIREASRRQAQNPQDFEYDEDSPRPNPFETILNIRTD